MPGQPSVRSWPSRRASGVVTSDPRAQPPSLRLLTSCVLSEIGVGSLAVPASVLKTHGRLGGVGSGNVVLGEPMKELAHLSTSRIVVEREREARAQSPHRQLVRRRVRHLRPHSPPKTPRRGSGPADRAGTVNVRSQPGSQLGSSHGRQIPSTAPVQEGRQVAEGKACRQARQGGCRGADRHRSTGQETLTIVPAVAAGHAQGSDGPIWSLCRCVWR